MVRFNADSSGQASGPDFSKSDTPFCGKDFGDYFDASGLANMTAMWQAAGCPEDKAPSSWIRSEEARGFVTALAERTGLGLDQLVSSIHRAEDPGVVAHWQVAIAYAEALSPVFQAAVNSSFLRYLREEANPTLKMLQAIKDNGELPDDEREFDYVLDLDVRFEQLGETLRDHGCRQAGTRDPFAEASDLLERIVLGRAPHASDGGTPGDAGQGGCIPLRDYEMAGIHFAIQDAGDLMEERGARGNQECIEACRDAATAIRALIDILENPDF